MDHITRDNFITERLKAKIAILIHKMFVIEVHSNRIFVMAKASNLVTNIFLKEFSILGKDKKGD